jgi:hypothetical protein
MGAAHVKTGAASALTSRVLMVKRKWDEDLAQIYLRESILLCSDTWYI